MLTYHIQKINYTEMFPSRPNVRGKLYSFPVVWILEVHKLIFCFEVEYHALENMKYLGLFSELS